MKDFSLVALEVSYQVVEEGFTFGVLRVSQGLSLEHLND